MRLSTTRLSVATEDLHELSPALRRAVALDPGSLVRIVVAAPTVSAFVRLPFGVLVARVVQSTQSDPAGSDTTVSAAELLAWLDGERPDPPTSRDAEWRTGLPPRAGWQRVYTVPDEVVRGLVRSGAQALKQAAEREGVPNAQPRAEVADALLDSVVLTVEDGGQSVQLTLRTLSALTRMGFLPRDSHIAVDVAGRWTRIAAAYGSVYAERPGSGLGLTLR
jgi:hypothetical protein